MEAFTTGKGLHDSVHKFSKISTPFVLNLVDDTFEQLGFSCWIVSASKILEHYSLGIILPENCLQFFVTDDKQISTEGTHPALFLSLRFVQGQIQLP